MTSISVIVTTRNRKYEVKRALGSIYAQTVQPLEVIVVDDGSTDGTREHIESLAYENLHYIYNQAEGKHSQGRSRNMGIQVAKGEYVAFLDSDSIWYPTKLEVFADKLKKLETKPDIICSRYKRHVKFRCKELPVKLDFECGMEEEILLQNIACASATVYRKKYLEEIGLFDEDMVTNADWELLLRGTHQMETNVIRVDEVLSESWTMYDGATEKKEAELKERLQLFSRYLDEIDESGHMGDYYRLYLEHERTGISEEKLDVELIRVCGDNPERIAKLLVYQRLETEKWRAHVNRKNSFYQLMRNWMQLNLNGGSIEEQLMKLGCFSVAIYGVGNHGRMLYEDLRDTQISVKYFIDKQKKEGLGEVPVYSLEEELPDADAVIITPYLEFASIQQVLQDKIRSRMIPLNALVQPNI